MPGVMPWKAKNAFVAMGLLALASWSVLRMMPGPEIHQQSSSAEEEFNEHCPDDVKSAFLEGSSGAVFNASRFRTFPDTSRRFGNGGGVISGEVDPEGLRVRCQGVKHWAVLTTIFEPSEAVRRLRFTELCVVIVGDKGRPVDYHFKTSWGQNLIFLDEKAQRSMGSSFVDDLPWNHFGRKNIGYLFAIAHGAEVIWDFDDDNMFKYWLEGASPLPGLEFRTYLPSDSSGNKKLIRL